MLFKISDIKLFHFKEAIADCDECLKFEPENIKALLRKGQALCSNDKRREVSIISELILPNFFSLQIILQSFKKNVVS